MRSRLASARTPASFRACCEAEPAKWPITACSVPERKGAVNAIGPEDAHPTRGSARAFYSLKEAAPVGAASENGQLAWQARLPMRVQQTNGRASLSAALLMTEQREQVGNVG